MAKNIIIVILSVLLGGLLVFTFTRGDSIPLADFEQIRIERDEILKGNKALKAENTRSLETIGELENKIITYSGEIKEILDKLADGNRKTEQHLDEYGRINNDFREFIRQNTTSE